MRYKNMDKKAEEKEYAKEYKEMWLRVFMYGNERQNKSSDVYVSLQTQIASVVFAFSVAFASSILEYAIFWAKFYYSLGLVLLVISLGLALINARAKNKFWDNVMGQNRQCLSMFDLARRGVISFKDARDKCDLALDNKSQMKSPSWPWQLQTLLLFLGTVIILGVVIRSIFN